MLLEPPLDPSGDEARSLLRRELLHPEYHQDNLILRLVNWLSRLLDRGLTEARELPPLTTFAAMLVGLLLLGAVGWLVSRARRVQRAPRERRGRSSPTSTPPPPSCAREPSGPWPRSGTPTRWWTPSGPSPCARSSVDRIDDLPGATAHEVAVALAEAFPGQGADVHRCAGLFDLVLYGGRPATRAQAVDVLGLDDRLGVRA